MKPKAYVADYKKEEVKHIKILIKKYPVFGIIDLNLLPSATLQSIRHKIKKNDVLIITAKKSLVKIAFEDLKNDFKNFEELEAILDKTQPALIFTTMNPFKLGSLVNKNKSAALAKPGQISPKDIVIPAGPTKFPPGPVIGELGAVGIKTIIQEGKITIKDDVDFVKIGETITKKKAEVLAKLGIEPMEIGMHISALYDKGIIYNNEMLSISEETYINHIKEAYQNSLNLGVFINYMSKETVQIAIKKAYLQSKSIASKTNLEFDESISSNKSAESSHEQKHHSDKGAVGFDEDSVQKAASLLKELQDQKIREKRT
jgi:large subunit ribosomal protein L10